MTDEDTARSWWSTVPGVLTAAAAVITAAGGLVAILAQNGLLQRSPANGERTTEQPRPGAPVSPNPGPSGAPPRADVSSSAVAHSPAEVIDGLRARGFHGIAVTSGDGTVTSLLPGAEIDGASLPLTSGQKVQFDRLQRVDIEQPWDGTVRLTFVNGQQLDTKTGNYSLTGKNELGPFRGFLSNMRSIEFLR